MGGTGIHDDNRQLEWLQQDQVFATTLLQKVLESYGDGKMVSYLLIRYGVLPDEPCGRNSVDLSFCVRRAPKAGTQTTSLDNLSHYMYVQLLLFLFFSSLMSTRLLQGERQARTDLAGAGGSGSGGQPSPRKRSTQTLPESQTSSSPSTSKVSTTPLPSPRKRGSALKKNENKSTPPATPVQIVLDRIPKVAGM